MHIQARSQDLAVPIVPCPVFCEAIPILSCCQVDRARSRARRGDSCFTCFVVVVVVVVDDLVVVVVVVDDLVSVVSVVAGGGEGAGSNMSV